MHGQQSLAICRDKHRVGAPFKWWVHVDGRVVALLGNGQSASVPITPGEHSLAIWSVFGEIPPTFSINVPPSESLFLLLRPKMRVTKGNAGVEIAETRPVSFSEAAALAPPVQVSRVVTACCLSRDAVAASPIDVDGIAAAFSRIFAVRLLEKSIAVVWSDDPEVALVVFRILRAKSGNAAIKAIVPLFAPATLEIGSRTVVGDVASRETESVARDFMHRTAKGGLHLCAVTLGNKLAQSLLKSLG